jgi:thioredoxin 1
VEVVLTNDNFNQEVLKSNLPVMVDFWSDWCMPCKMLAPVIEAIAKEYEGKLKVCKLNVDDAQEIAIKYGVMSIPTLIFFKKGEVKDEIVGAVPKSMIEDKIKLYIEE